MTYFYWRKLKNILYCSLIVLLAFGALAPLLSILSFLIEKGSHGITWSLFTELPQGPGQAGGGMANAFVGSLIMVCLSTLVAWPLGLLVGIYLNEYGEGKLSKYVNLALDLWIGTPSIVIGMFVYAFLVARAGFSAYAGSVALTIIMVPFTARAVQEILKLIPDHIREAGLALGLPRWRVIVSILLPGTRGALLTAGMLAVARAAGETAPLLLTSLGNQFFSSSLSEPTASVPVQVYNFVKSGFDHMEKQAFAAALVLVVFIFMANLLLRGVLWFTSKRYHST